MADHPQVLQVDLKKASGYLSDLYEDLETRGPQNAAAKWAACVRTLADVEQTWEIGRAHV